MTKNTSPDVLTPRFVGTPRTWSHFRVFSPRENLCSCDKQQQRHQGVKRSGVNDEATRQS